MKLDINVNKMKTSIKSSDLGKLIERRKKTWRDRLHLNKKNESEEENKTSSGGIISNIIEEKKIEKEIELEKIQLTKDREQKSSNIMIMITIVFGIMMLILLGVSIILSIVRNSLDTRFILDLVAFIICLITFVMWIVEIGKREKRRKEKI